MEEGEMYFNPDIKNFEECSSGAINGCINAEECSNTPWEWLESCEELELDSVSTVEHTYSALEPAKHQ